MSAIKGRGTKSITVNLSSGGMRKLVQKLSDVEMRVGVFCERLAIAIAQRASANFSSAIYDGTNDVAVSVEPTEGGFEVKASGKSVCFIEFGSGVYHNQGGEPYPDRPEGIAGIGEYGRGLGKGSGWVFHGDPGTNGVPLTNGRVFTRGNPANLCLWNAVQDTITDGTIDDLAKEVFGA